MSKKETSISHRILVELSRRAVFIMRNNRGKFRTLDGKRIVEAGLSVNGSSDLIGWRSVTITPEMVGSKIAVFLAIEVKTETGKVSPEQQRFIDNLKAAGGIGFIARSKKDIDDNL